MFISLRETEDRKFFFTSDPHLGHQRDFVWKARGFESADAHTDGWINKINELVKANDILFCLGDFCLNTPLSKFNEYLSRINCQNILSTWGNHNNPHEKNVYQTGMGNKFLRDLPVMNYPYEYRNMVYLPHYVEAALNGQFIVLCHYPMSIWNEMQSGSWMLCGHSHYGFEASKATNLSAKILDVGWDGHNSPWSFSEIAEVMSKKTFTKVDHHG